MMLLRCAGGGAVVFVCVCFFVFVAFLISIFFFVVHLNHFYLFLVWGGELASHTQVLGFGLAVQRQEAVVDCPTLMRIPTISATLVARSALEDAVRHTISLEGHTRAHGGFEIQVSLFWLHYYYCFYNEYFCYKIIFLFLFQN